jgi:hypothetical protein
VYAGASGNTGFKSQPNNDDQGFPTTSTANQNARATQ